MATRDSNNGQERSARDNKPEVTRYEKPQILCREKLEVAASSCNYTGGKADNLICEVAGS
jgi:hypothetical protein